MKTLLLALLSSGLIVQAQAGDLPDHKHNVRSLHHNNFIGQRPHHKMPDVQTEANQAWEGTGFVAQNPEQVEKALIKHNQHQMHFMGKRPYHAPNNAD